MPGTRLSASHSSDSLPMLCSWYYRAHFEMQNAPKAAQLVKAHGTGAVISTCWHICRQAESPAGHTGTQWASSPSS